VTILSERGLFWWHHDPIPAKHFAPDSSVTGLLEIHDDGRTTLELDGCLQGDSGPWSSFLSSEDAWLEGKRIQGVLKVSNNHVLLCQLSRNGGTYSTHGLSYESYFAAECLLGERPFPSVKSPLTFSEFEINLEGFERWLRLGSIKTKRKKSSISIRYLTPKQVSYTLGSGAKLKIKFDILGPVLRGGHQIDQVKLQERAVLVYRHQNKMAFKEIKSIFNSLDDLFTLLTDSEYPLGWPSVWLRRKSIPTKYKFYFVRVVDYNDRPSAPEKHTCPTNFVQLRDRFGEIVSRWLSKKEKIGPGFYLYTGLRRGMRLYTEHQFASLMWGLESFHRRTEATTESIKRKEEKIVRILDQIASTKDRKWAQQQLRAEPNLEDRLFSVLSRLTINISPCKLRVFCRKCAARRNELSHFGAQRKADETSEAFYEDLQTKIQALSTLYYLLILIEIGIDEHILLSWFYNGFHSYQRKMTLIRAGLLNPEHDSPSPRVS
jgi:hypothetical protein